MELVSVAQARVRQRAHFIIMPDTKKVRQEEGLVEEALPGATFKVRLKDNRLVHGYLAGKMRLYHIKIIPGDRVLIEFGVYDDNKGRITRRL